MLTGGGPWSLSLTLTLTGLKVLVLLLLRRVVATPSLTRMVTREVGRRKSSTVRVRESVH